MRIALFGKSYKPEHQTPLQTVFDELKSHQIPLILYEGFYHKIKEHINISPEIDLFSTHQELGKQTDYLFSIGGDGTLLDTLKFIRNSGIPILGINLGRMGFLSSIGKDHIKEAIQKVTQLDFDLDQRSLLQLSTPGNLFGEMNYALNELSINRNTSEGMLTIKAFVNGDYLNTYWGDGLIVATPTGSTAYSLSSNGPIILPGSQNLVITPIATHNLTVRPIVIPDDCEIRLSIEGRVTEYFVSLDSRSVKLNTDVELVIKKESFSINLMRLKDENFFQTIRKKLMWGLDIRN